MSDEQGERIQDRLPRRAGSVGVTAKGKRLFVEAVLYRYRAGIAWRDLPERFGAFSITHPTVMQPSYLYGIVQGSLLS